MLDILLKVLEVVNASVLSLRPLLIPVSRFPIELCKLVPHTALPSFICATDSPTSLDFSLNMRSFLALLLK